MISVWSVLTASLWFVLATVFLCVLHNRVEFLKRHGITLWVLVIALTIVRLLLPLDGEHMIVIRSYTVLPVLRRGLSFEVRQNVSVGMALSAVWVLGSVLGLAYVALGMAFDCFRRRRLLLLPLSPKMKVAAQASGVSAGMICFAPEVGVPKTVGCLRPTIYLPSDAYSERELYWILKHEAGHVAGHDGWLNLAFLLFRCFFWWNPFVHIAQWSVTEVLELRCDRRALKDAGVEGRTEYAQALYHAATQGREGAKFFVNAGAFLRPDQNKMLTLRVNMAMDGAPSLDRTVAVAIVLSVVLFFLSYMFILQPAEMPPEIDEETVFVTTSDTTYLRKISETEYELWDEEGCVCTLPAEALNDDLFRNLEVRP